MLLLAGCGGTTSAPKPASGGKQIFRDSCSACHTLADADAHGTIGSNLDVTMPTRAEVLAAIEYGKSQMPADIVTGEDAQRVASYVARAAR
jgi:cytochrome c6